MKIYSKKNRYSKTKPRKRYSKRTKSMKIKKNNKRLTRLGKLWIKQMEIYMKFREVQ